MGNHGNRLKRQYSTSGRARQAARFSRCNGGAKKVAWNQPKTRLRRLNVISARVQERISRQIEIIAKLENHGHEQMIDEARDLLAALQQTLELAWWHLQMERVERGLDPETGMPAPS